VHCVPTHSTVSDLECALFVTHVFANHGMPKTAISDRGVPWNYQLWKNLLRALGIQHVMSTAYHPQTNGQTERTNKIPVECYAHI
jgi:transposase InsO family protein